MKGAVTVSQAIRGAGAVTSAVPGRNGVKAELDGLRDRIRGLGFGDYEVAVEISALVRGGSLAQERVEAGGPVSAQTSTVPREGRLPASPGDGARVWYWEAGTRQGIYDIRQLLQLTDALQAPRLALLPVILGQPHALSDLLPGPALPTGGTDHG